MLLKMAESWAEFSDKKLVVQLDKHKIDMEFVDTDEYKYNDAFYDDRHYINGNIFIKGYANPIKPVFDRTIEDADELDDDKVVEKLKLKPSLRYKTFMREDKIRQIAGAKWDTGINLMTALMLVGLSVGAVFIAMMFLM